MSPTLARCIAALLLLAGFAGLARPATAALPPGQTDAPRWIAMYQFGGRDGYLGLVMGQPDRASARAAVEASCRRMGTRCQIIAEFAQRCGAVAQVLQQPVRRAAASAAINLGAPIAAAGRTSEEAQQAALEACSARSNGAYCVIAVADCARQ